MKRVAIWIAATVTVVVLLFGYHAASTRTPTGPTTGSADQQAQVGASSGPFDGSFSGEFGKRIPAGSKTFTGKSALTERGPVEVELIVKHNKVTGVNLPQVPTEDPMDVEINQFAVPILIRETISSQSAKIDMVSGATVTSEGYLQSLQSALDRAGI